MLDAPSFRRVMGSFPTGVTVVTTVGGDGVPMGLTVNSFTSVSLDPPLVLVCIDRDSASHDALLRAGAFAVNVLSSEQAQVATRFASDPAAERFEGTPWRSGPSGVPVLEGGAAWLSCRVEAVHPGGDHSILVGRVEDGGHEERSALLFHRGAFGATSP